MESRNTRRPNSNSGVAYNTVTQKAHIQLTVCVQFTLVSHSQTTFSSFVLGWEKGLVFVLALRFWGGNMRKAFSC